MRRFNQTKIGLKVYLYLKLYYQNHQRRFNQTKIGLKDCCRLHLYCRREGRFNQTKIGLKGAICYVGTIKLLDDLIRLK